jgi:imidazolonepropionase-like amidohydrolase
VIRSATVTPARKFKKAKSLGQIKEGFEADVLFLGADPLEDVTILDRPDESVIGVMKEGRVYKSRPSTLAEDGQALVRIMASL